MRRIKFGNPKKKSRFICLKCGHINGVGDGIQRGGCQREKFHIKDLYCTNCKAVEKNIEVRYCDCQTEITKEIPKLRLQYYGKCS